METWLVRIVTACIIGHLSIQCNAFKQVEVGFHGPKDGEGGQPEARIRSTKKAATRNESTTTKNKTTATGNGAENVKDGSETVRSEPTIPRDGATAAKPGFAPYFLTDITWSTPNWVNQALRLPPPPETTTQSIPNHLAELVLGNKSSELSWDRKLKSSGLPLQYGNNSWTINEAFLNFSPPEANNQNDQNNDFTNYTPLHQVLYQAYYRYARLILEQRFHANKSSITAEQALESYCFVDEGSQVNVKEVLLALKTPDILELKIQAVRGLDKNYIHTLFYRRFEYIHQLLDQCEQLDTPEKRTTLLGELHQLLELAAGVISGGHCLARTLQFLQNTSMASDPTSKMPLTVPGKIYQLLYEFKVECFNQACEALEYQLKASYQHTGSVSFRNYLLHQLIGIISLPGQGFAQHDSFAQWYLREPFGSHFIEAPAKLKDLNSHDNVRKLILEKFYARFNVDSMTKYLSDHLNQGAGTMVSATQFGAWMKTNGVSQADYTNIDDGKIDAAYIQAVLGQLCIFRKKTYWEEVEAD